MWPDTLFTPASDLIRAGQEHELKCPRCARSITKVQRGDRFWPAVYDGCHVRLEVWDGD